MACEYCEHRSLAYRHHKDEQGHDIYEKAAKTLPYDDVDLVDVEPMLSWPNPEVIDWADHKPRLCITAFDCDGEEVCISIPINYCPICGEELPRTETTE